MMGKKTGNVCSKSVVLAELIPQHCDAYFALSHLERVGDFRKNKTLLNIMRPHVDHTLENCTAVLFRAPKEQRQRL